MPYLRGYVFAGTVGWMAAPLLLPYTYLAHQMLARISTGTLMMGVAGVVFSIHTIIRSKSLFLTPLFYAMLVGGVLLPSMNQILLVEKEIKQKTEARTIRQPEEKTQK